MSNSDLRILRNREIARLYVEEHKTLQEIGDQYGMTRERVRQILHRAGITGGYRLDRVIPDLQRRVKALEERLDANPEEKDL